MAGRDYGDEVQRIVHAAQQRANECIAEGDLQEAKRVLADAVRQIVTTYTTIKADVAAKMTLPQYKSEIDKASVDKLNNLMVTDGLLTAPVDLSKLLP